MKSDNIIAKRARSKTVWIQFLGNFLTSFLYKLNYRFWSISPIYLMNSSNRHCVIKWTLSKHQIKTIAQKQTKTSRMSNISKRR